MVHYRWKELELISIQTLSNIITFIQYALIPFEFILIGNQSNKDKIEQFITINLRTFSKIFTAPFDFNNQFKKIITPIRTMISSLAIFSFISFLYNIFFQPSWCFILFFLDLFLPGAFFYGLNILIQKENEHQTAGIILIVFGSIFFILRILFFFLPLCNNKNKKWYIKIGCSITSVFLSRIKKDKNEEELDQHTHKIHKEIDKREYSIQFDNEHFNFKSRIIDFCITFAIWFIILIIVIIGWKKILKNAYRGKQLDDITLVANAITYILFSGIFLRLIFNIIWLVRPIEDKVFYIFNIMKIIAYKGIIFLIGVSILPILKMGLMSIESADLSCDWYQYYDSRSNTDSFLQYFIKRDGDVCVNCSKTSANSVWPCKKICYYDPKYNPYTIAVLSDYIQITSHESHKLFFLPTLFLLIFYLIVLNILLRQIYIILFNIVTVLPAPTKNIECKYQTLLNTLKTPAVGVLKSYRYKSSLHYFNFSQYKTFILYFFNLLLLKLYLDIDDPVFLRIAISLAFTVVNFIIAIFQFFTSPYISILHNIVNFVSFTVAGITAFFITLHTSEILILNNSISYFFVVIVVIAPILTALIVPFFAKKDPILEPTELNLIRMQKWDNKLNKLIRFKVEKMKAMMEKKKRQKENSIDEDFDFENDGILVEDEPSISISYNQKHNDDDTNHINLIGQFDLLKLAPIKVQEEINNECLSKKEKNDQEYRLNACNVWCKHDIYEDEFDKATNEMLESSNKLIDCNAYNNLSKLIHFALIVSSACFGQCLISGILQWQKIIGPNGSQYYQRCNMFPNGTYPAFGTY